jgi:isopentenyldiphosphate isomerase
VSRGKTSLREVGTWENYYYSPLTQRSRTHQPDSVSLVANRWRLQCYSITVDEKIDILNSVGEKTGKVAWKSEAHRLGLWHRCFHCWIVSPETPSGDPYLFVQRRAAEKETWPDRLDVTVGGHLGTGEEALDGLREVEEELGLAVSAAELIPLGSRRAELEIPAGLDREFQEVFLLVRLLSSEDLQLQEEEVAAVLRLRLDDIEALYEGAQIPAEEWTGVEESPTSVQLTEFVPSEDGYLIRTARIAREVLAGKRPDALM